jgi:hypothetical protein
MPDNNLQEIFQETEKQMRAEINKIRAKLKHAGNKGASAETICRQFLRQYLPRKYEIGNGEIIDTFGNRSSQSDIVIVDSAIHPFTFTEDEEGLFFLEGVTGVGEAKISLNSSHLNLALENSHRFKAMKQVSITEFHTNNMGSDHERFYSYKGSPPYFLLAFGTKIKLETIVKNINNYRFQHNLGDFSVLDAIFIVGHGVAINLGDGKGAYRIRNAEGMYYSGWFIANESSVIFTFLAWLSVTMPIRNYLSPILPRYIMKVNQE